MSSPDRTELRADVDVQDWVWIPGQTTVVGSDDHYPEEAPAHEVSVDGFWMAAHQVTNAEFAEFISATGYLTVAERDLDPAGYPGAPAENLQPGSMVFHRTPGPVDLRHLSQWWTWTPGACWNHPRGPRSGLTGREHHPVVHVAFEDAQAYADWAGAALPNEAQWEVAARGGLARATYTWGDDPETPGLPRANYWHGEFPYLPETGYGTTKPVGSFPANDYGLFDMAGNVWEWTADWHGAYGKADEVDPKGPAKGAERVIRGGAWNGSQPTWVRPSFRYSDKPTTRSYGIGFRCAKTL